MHWDVWKIFENPVFIAGFLSWFIAQGLKIFTPLPSTGRIAPSMFFNSGGMPSSHSSVVLSVATTVGILHGFDSAIFAIAISFAIIVMYDAAGVRYETGKQAQIINDLVELMKQKDEFNAEKLKELIGHHPIEVLSGALLGIVIAVVYCLTIT